MNMICEFTNKAAVMIAFRNETKKIIHNLNK